ncbi:MAG TPA: carboxymuconolactone decarboxylase family protein [Azospirillaceae bacterium]|nr:carboxymuconolactone decarboxylase family protein [Azospirillaceae bacterium]
MLKSFAIAPLTALALLAGAPAAGLAQQAGQTAVTAPQAASPAAQQTLREIEQTLGTVPSFFRDFPEAGLPGAWEEFKTVQMSDKTALSNKEKELIGLAVAAQIPCTYCIYAHTTFARMAGATDQEVKETLAMAAIVRHWSTVLNGSQTELSAFKQQIDRIAEHARQTAQTQAPATAGSTNGE